jgi:hypothetical protein
LSFKKRFFFNLFLGDEFEIVCFGNSIEDKTFFKNIVLNSQPKLFSSDINLFYIKDKNLFYLRKKDLKIEQIYETNQNENIKFFTNYFHHYIAIN